MQISCGFHEIWQISGEIHRISCGFQVKSGRFQVKSGGFQVKSGGFHEIRQISESTYKTDKSNISRKTLQFYGVLWEGYVMFSHEIRRISKDQLPGMVSPMFNVIFHITCLLEIHFGWPPVIYG